MPTRWVEPNPHQSQVFPRRDFLRLASNGVALLGFAGSGPAAAQNPGLERAVQARALRIGQEISIGMRNLAVPGVSVAVVNDCKLEWTLGYGFADLSTKLPTTAETLFQAASVSKVAATIAALRLVGEGHLSLDDDINERLRAWKLRPNPYTARRAVTLRHLLTHSAGFNVHGFAGYSRGRFIPSIVQVLEGPPFANSAPIVVTQVPGTASQYSGGGFCVLQQLLIEVTGKPFAEYLNEAVFTPLGMEQSTFSQPLPPSMESRSATGHLANQALVPFKWNVYPELAAAGLWTTTADLARLGIEIMSAALGRGTILSRQLAQLMLTPQIQNQYGPIGLCVFLNRSRNPTRFHHSGTNSGFQCRLAGTTNGKGAVVMTNSDNGGRLAAEAIDKIAELYGWP